MLKSRWFLMLGSFATGIALAAVVWPAVSGSARQKAARDEVAAMIRQQQEAWNAGDLAGFLKDYEMSDAITFYSDDSIAQGWVSLNDRYQRRYGGGKTAMGKLVFSDLHFDVLAPDAVMIRGRWATSENTRPGSGLFTILVRKTEAGWRIVHDHTSAKRDG